MPQNVIITDLENAWSAFKGWLASLESEMILIWQQAFPAAEQAAIAALIPMGQQIITDLQNQGNLTGKQIASEALEQMETALVAAGKDFVITFAMQAVSTVMAQKVGNTATATSTVSNGGSLPGGTQIGG